MADKLNSAPKYVISTTLDKADWNNSTVISTNVIEEIQKLKGRAGGDIWIMGSRRLIQSLMKTDLIDEYRLAVYPIVLGEGQRLFDEKNTDLKLQLVQSKTFDSGVIELRYQPVQAA